MKRCDAVKIMRDPAMGHGLILGMTESGKSTLAKSMSKQLQSRGWFVVVLDPINDPRWEPDYTADDVNDLLYILKKSRSCFVFVDEAGQVCGQHDTDNLWLATQSRHWGHSVFFICQRGSQLAKTIREQCSFLYLFACSKSDSTVLANEWNREKLLEANTLKRGEYLYAPRFKEVKKYSIFKERRENGKEKKGKVGQDRSAEISETKGAHGADP